MTPELNFQWPAWMGSCPRQNTPWNPEEEALLISRYHAGDSLTTLARRHGRMPGGIESRLFQSTGENFSLRAEKRKMTDAELYKLRKSFMALREQADAALAALDKHLGL